jgi:hypothetical protein
MKPLLVLLVALTLSSWVSSVCAQSEIKAMSKSETRDKAAYIRVTKQKTEFRYRSEKGGFLEQTAMDDMPWYCTTNCALELDFEAGSVHYLGVEFTGQPAEHDVYEAVVSGVRFDRKSGVNCPFPEESEQEVEITVLIRDYANLDYIDHIEFIAVGESEGSCEEKIYAGLLIESD